MVRTALLIVVLLCTALISCVCLTDLEYSMSKTKTGSAEIVEDSGLHGSSAAKVMVYENGSSKSITISLEGELTIDMLTKLSLYLKPLSEDGEVEVLIHLDGDGDGKYGSKDISDARLRTSTGSWKAGGMPASGWSEVDLTQMRFSSDSQDQGKEFDDKNLSECKEMLGELKVVKIYITLKRKGKSSSVLVDYIKIGDEIISFEPLETQPLKKAKQSSAAFGSTLTYIITYGNNLNRSSDVVVRETYDPRSIFLSAYPQPDPGTNNIWTIRSVPPGGHGQITVRVKTKKRSANGKMESSISGSGYANVRHFATTSAPEYILTNRVTMKSDEFNRTGEARIRIRPYPGLTMQSDEHGSGFFTIIDREDYSQSSLMMSRDISAILSGSSIRLNGNLSATCRNLSLKSPWSAFELLRNTKRGTVIMERYQQASRLDVTTSALLKSNGTIIRSDASLDGMSLFDARGKQVSMFSSGIGNHSIHTSAEATEIKRKVWVEEWLNDTEDNETDENDTDEYIIL